MTPPSVDKADPSSHINSIAWAPLVGKRRQTFARRLTEGKHKTNIIHCTSAVVQIFHTSLIGVDVVASMLTEQHAGWLGCVRPQKNTIDGRSGAWRQLKSADRGGPFSVLSNV